MSVTPERLDIIAMALTQSTLLVTRRLVDRAELNMTALETLHRLETDGPTRLTALATAAGVSQPAMTQLIHRLEQREIVGRAVDNSDGRAMLVAITDVGRTALKERRQALRDRLAEVLADLEPAEQAALELANQVAVPLLKRLNASDRTILPSRASAWETTNAR